MTSRKRCSACLCRKPLGDFHRNKNIPDGHTYVCKACRKLSDREKRRAGALQTAPREKKRCVICHRILLIAAFRPDRIDPDGGDECVKCAKISPWKPTALLLAFGGMLDHLAVYDDDMPIAAGLRA